MREYFSSTEAMREALFKAKEEHRRKMAKLPFKKKLAILLELQQCAMSANPKFAKKWKGILPWRLK